MPPLRSALPHPTLTLHPLPVIAIASRRLPKQPSLATVSKCDASFECVTS
ncbi:MAG: hypothetical protein AB1589_11800 [Cyanobacteriota bacterium]